MATNKKISDLTELSEGELSNDDVLPIVDVSAGTTHKVRKDTLAAALSGVSSISATSPIAVNQSTGSVTVSTGTIPVASGGTGATSLTDGGVLLGSGTGAVTAMAVLSDGQMIVGDGTTDPVAESGATLRTSIGCDAAGTDNSTNVTLAGSLDYLTISGQEITRNAVVLTTDVSGTLPVANGGSGATSLTDGGVLLGSGTGAITATAVLADGEMLVGDGSTDPSIESGATLRTSIGLGTGDNAQFTNLTATGAFTSLGIDDNSTANRLTLSDTLLTSVEPIYSGANSMIADGLHVETGASGMGTAAGAANDFVIEGSANTGMSILSPAANSQHIYFGDANANDIGRINYDHSIDDMSFWTNTVERVTISSAGEVTTPTQPSFQGRTGTLSNVTGDGTNYTILFPTERFDVGANFASPTYTAPVTGKYLLTISMELRGLTSSHTDMLWHAVTSNLTYSLGRYNPYAISVSGIITANGSVYVDMDAADTMTITVQVNGGTKVVDIDEAFWSVALIG